MVINTIDEDYKLGESTTMESINHFNVGIWTWFKSIYLKQELLSKGAWCMEWKALARELCIN
jgi:hypothetical protein